MVTFARSAALTRPHQERKPYEPFGAARSLWRSAHREVLLSGPADTGKSRGWLEKLHYCADKYPHSRSIIVRKTRKSITQSAQVTYERRVLPEGLLSKRARPGHIHWSTSDQEYQYPNGSIIAVGGLDDPEKVKSSEWDIIYCQEATELSEHDWEMLTRGLRNGAMPYQQLGGDCNPGPPTHWLKRRCDRGATRMLLSRHEDNPSLTPQRMATLDALTGVRYLRLRKGIWAAAEGMVYEGWDPALHKLSRADLARLGLLHTDGVFDRRQVKEIFGTVDWGYTNPGVLQVWARDGDGRLYLLRELYRVSQTDDWWIMQALALQGEFGVELWVADPSQPAYIAKFNQAGLPCIGACNDIQPGISEMTARLRKAGDGRPRLSLYEFSLMEPDPARVASYQPVGFESEIESYVWQPPKDGQPAKEVPVKFNDHAMDAARYACMYAAGNQFVGPLDAEIASQLAYYQGY